MNRERDKREVGNLIATYGVEGLLKMISDECCEIAASMPKKHVNMKSMYRFIGWTVQKASDEVDDLINQEMPEA